MKFTQVKSLDWCNMVLVAKGKRHEIKLLSVDKTAIGSLFACLLFQLIWKHNRQNALNSFVFLHKYKFSFISISNTINM